MSQQKQINIQFWAALLLFALIGIVAYSLRTKKIIWQETYQNQPNISEYKPFDVSLLRKLLTTFNSKINDIDSKLAIGLPDDGANQNYLFIGEAMHLDSNDAQRLQKFISRGNNAFIASKYISPRLLAPVLNQNVLNTLKNNESIRIDSTYYDEDGELSDTTLILPEPVVETNKSNTEYEVLPDSIFQFTVFYPDTFHYKTGYYNSFGVEKLEVQLSHLQAYVDKAYVKNPTVLGNIQGKYANFLVIPYGKGKLYLHTNPIVFSNVEMIDPNGKKYIEKALSVLPKETLYWDNFNQTDINTARFLDMDQATPEKANNILKYIIGHKSLASAWYLILATVLLFAIFTAKRRQRIIPVIAQKKNTTLIYLQALGKLYFRQRNHTAIAKMKYKHFLSFIRQRYGISTTQLNEAFFQRLTQKSGVSQANIKEILESSAYLERYAVDEAFLVRFHQQLSYFYQNCK